MMVQSRRKKSLARPTPPKKNVGVLSSQISQPSQIDLQQSHSTREDRLEQIKNKINAFSHQEFNNETFTNKEHIEDCIKNGKSLFHPDPTRTEKIYHIPLELNKNLPQDYHLLL